MLRLGRQGLAYVCFLPPIIASLIAGMGAVLPLGDGAGGVLGLGVLVPLAMMSLVSVPIGIILTILYRRDVFLLVLSVLTIFLVAEIVTETGSAEAYNAIGWLYGIFGAILEVRWFRIRRRRDSASNM